MSMTAAILRRRLRPALAALLLLAVAGCADWAAGVPHDDDQGYGVNVGGAGNNGGQGGGGSGGHGGHR